MERSTERPAELIELFEQGRIARAEQATADLERTHDRVKRRFEGGHLTGRVQIESSGRRGAHVEILAEVQLDTKFVPQLAGALADTSGQLIGIHMAKVANQDGNTLAIASRLAPPAVGLQPLGVVDVNRLRPSPGGRVVHDVVVDEGEHLEKFEGCADVDHQLFGIVLAGGRGRVIRPAASLPGPVTEGGPEPLAAAGHHAGQLADRLAEPGIDRFPVGRLLVEYRLQAGVDLLGHHQQLVRGGQI